MANTIVVFDLDDTLYSKSQVFFDTFSKFSTVTMSSQELYQLYQEKSDEAFEQFSNGEITLEESHQLRVAKTFQALQQPLSSTQVDQFSASYQKQMAHIQLSRDWQQTLNYLAEDSSVTMAILTNGPTEHQTKKLQQLGISKWISPNQWFISEAMGVAKPDEQSFSIIEKTLPARRYVMIGDSVTNDILPALKRNWNAILWRTSTQQNPPKGAFIAKKTSDILEIIHQNYQ